MMKDLRALLLCSLGLLFCVSGAKAQDGMAMASTGSSVEPAATTPATEPAAEEEEKESPYSLSGAVDAYYLYSFNHMPFPTSFTGSHNSFTLGMANLIFTKEGKVGFTADLAFGPRAEAANGYLTDEGGITSLSLIKQLFVTYSPSDKLKFTLGNFSTFVGYELIDAPGNVNYSTSYLFSNGPFYHTGLKADIALADKFGLMLGVFNDTDTKVDVVKGKHIGAQLSYTGDKLSAFLNYLGGRHQEETPFTPEVFSHQVDLTATLAVTDAFSLGLNSSMRDFHPAEGEDASWFGTALYAKYAVSDGFALGFRGEYMSDKDGIITGLTDGNVLALTLSGNIMLGSLTIIPEFRIDQANEEGYFLDKDGKPTKSSAGFLTAVVYSF
ncbi:MAG: porin [Lewinella sp.]|nr:porin [Lewinella sp.]